MSEPESVATAERFIAEAPVGLATLDGGLRVTFANRAFAEMTGRTSEELLGHSLAEVLAGFPELDRAARRVIESGASAPPLEIAETAAAPGAVVRRSWRLALQPVAVGGEVVGLGIVATDVTEATLARAAYQPQADRDRIMADFLARVARAGDDEEQVIRILASHAADAGGGACAISLITPDGTRAEVAVYEDVDDVRLAAGRPLAAGDFALEGSSIGAVVESGTSLLMPSVSGTDLELGPPEWHQFRRHFPLLSLACMPVYVGRAIIGAITVYRYEQARPAFDEEDVRFFEMLADGAAVILDVARTHRALADTARRMALIVDESPLATIMVDIDFRVELWNRAAEEMFGWTRDEVLGETLAIAPPDLEDEIAELRDSIIGGAGITGLETRRLRRDGTEIGVALYEAPLRDSGGEVIGAVLLLANTVEQKRLEAELVQARKMETIGRLAGGIAHDFNNILTVLTGYASLLAAEADDPAAVRQDARLVGDVAIRASGLTRQLLAFSRRHEANVSVLDANEVVMGVHPLIARLVGEGVEVVAVVEREAVRLRADQAQLQQVMLNLAANARDAMPSGGRLVIQTGMSHFDRTSLSRHFEMPAGDYATISVTDTGIGMDEQTRSRLFEPYFTTKPMGQGTGLGLATSYNIVKQAQGYISVYSEPGHGSTFRLYFPAVEGAVKRTERAPSRARKRTGRVLLVEDEAELRVLAQRVLVDSGFDVEVAPGPAEAIALCRKNQLDGIDVLITDVIMPGMTGPELAGRLQLVRPDLAVLLMSGHTEEIVAANPGTGAGFLAKPFTPDQLLDAVDAVLARKGAPSGLDPAL